MITLDEKTFDDHVHGSDILVGFSATWCQPCKAMTPSLTAIDESMIILVGKVDIDQSPNLATRFGVRSVPTFVLFKDGENIASRSGAMSHKHLVRWIKEALVG